MSEENNVIYCGQCGSKNPDTFKFCSNCGAKLERLQEDAPSYRREEAVFSGSQTSYEKVDAEIVSDQQPVEDEFNINYGAEEGTYSSGGFDSASSRYYSSNNSVNMNYEQQSNGNIGFAIASMVCGILSLLCCCFSLFSLVLGIAAVVLGIVSINGKYDGKGMAIAGIITGGIGIFIWVVLMLIGGSGLLLDLIDELSYY